MVKWTVTSVLLLIVAGATLAAPPAEGVVLGTVERFSGSASGIGLGPGKAGVRIVGRFTTPSPSPFVCSTTATAALLAVIEDGSGDVVVTPFPLVLTGSSTTTCIFEQSVTGPPFVRLLVREVGDGIYNFRIEVSQGTRPAIGSPPCPTAALKTSFMLVDSTTTLVTTTQNWTCFGTGNRYLNKR
jgi:hypothetical protein